MSISIYAYNICRNWTVKHYFAVIQRRQGIKTNVTFVVQLVTIHQFICRFKGTARWGNPERTASCSQAPYFLNRSINNRAAVCHTTYYTINVSQLLSSAVWPWENSYCSDVLHWWRNCQFFCFFLSVCCASALYLIWPSLFSFHSWNCVWDSIDLWAKKQNKTGFKKNIQ